MPELHNLPAAPRWHRWLQALARGLWNWWQVFFLGAQILVLAFTPSSYSATMRERLALQMVAGTASVLLWFSGLAALVTLVLTRIVVVTAESYGLTQYALQVVIRVLVIELIPLCAVLFVALRSTLASATELAALRRQGVLQDMRTRGLEPLAEEALPRVLAGIHASITLAALSCVVALVLAYVAVYGLNLAALPAYTRLFGQVFDPTVTLIFLLKTVFFGLAVAVMPVVSALVDRLEQPGRGGDMNVLARMFLALLLIEVLCLVGNYY
jgi:phospholipid/cholesterol/gamma-HCH transport system permease protein